MAGRPKKIVEQEEAVVEKIQMIDSEKVKAAKINLLKFEAKYNATFPHVMYFDKGRYLIESEAIEPDSKLYMLLEKEGVLDDN
jgi:hypothetical protein